MKEVIRKQTPEIDTLSRVRLVLDEYGDFSSRPGVVREAGFSFPEGAAILEVEEVIDENDLDGPSVFKVRGGDDRNAVWRLSPDVSLDPHAEAALQRDLNLYVDPKKAGDFRKRFGETAVNAIRRSLH